MKTNQIITRKMGDFDVYQRTQDAMFNASSLMEQWNTHRKDQKKMSRFLEMKETKAFMEELVNEVRNNKLDESTKMYLSNNETVTEIPLYITSPAV